MARATSAASDGRAISAGRPVAASWCTTLAASKSGWSEVSTWPPKDAAKSRMADALRDGAAKGDASMVIVVVLRLIGTPIAVP
ncbi:MAG: hypothetical protein U0838_06670 [Chloroflexota bacterium]